jgi:glycerol uptake facilitator-like aquaporin
MKGVIMKASTMFIVNLALTCITCVFLIFSCGGCTAEQFDKAASTAPMIDETTHAMAPILQSQPWYIFVLLAGDIASSAAAAWVAYSKSKTAQK